MRKKIIIMGAAGRDFHNFNVLYRDNESIEVVAFTAAQIPDIDDRKYPAALAGKLYPDGIPIASEDSLINLIKEHDIEEVVFSYSDLSHNEVLQKGSMVLAAGAAFSFADPVATMIPSSKPVVSVCAVRTGCGKSQTTRFVTEILKAQGKKTVVIRHPMPYGDLAKQAVQRFAELGDLDKHNCTLEEREEYEHHINAGSIVYAGVDYGAILKEAEKECDVILWDGGNNDTPFYKSNLEIVVVDPHRPGHEISYYPGMVNFLRANLIVINKMDSAEAKDIGVVERNIKKYNPNAIVVKADSEITVDKPELIKGKKVLVVEDGPTLTHGEMKYGAGTLAAKRNNCEIIDPRPYTTGKIKETFEIYPNIGELLPAMGYSEQQLKDLETTINKTPCDAVVVGTPIDLSRSLKIDKPHVLVSYSLKEQGTTHIESKVKGILSQPC